jgi:xanthine dehydrogenase accessory factor
MHHSGGEARPDATGDSQPFLAALLECLGGGERVALCTVLRLDGSGPRRPGAKLLVRERGETLGTVGGGPLEMQATAWALEALRTRQASCRPFLLDHRQASEEGMTCGGEVELLVEVLDGTDPAVRRFYGEVLTLLRGGKQGFLVTALPADGDGVATAHWLVAEGRCLAATSSAPPPVPADLSAPAPSTPSLMAHGGIRYFLDPLAPPVSVYVFGGGHIALHLAPLCRRLGFRVVVVDDRAEFVSRERFPEADELLHVPSFDGALDDLPIDRRSFVVVVTRGHGGDLAILGQSLARRPAFLGMIGSARKRALIYEQLARQGVAADALARVACPIGLPIGAETPEEIAVSIVAQLVAVRRGKG